MPRKNTEGFVNLRVEMTTEAREILRQRAEAKGISSSAYLLKAAGLDHPAGDGRFQAGAFNPRFRPRTCTVCGEAIIEDGLECTHGPVHSYCSDSPLADP